MHTHRQLYKVIVVGVRESTPKLADKVILVRGRDDAHTNTPTR